MELLASGDYFIVLDELARRDKRIFVDLKFFDIPATVAGVIRGLSRWPVTFCTVHGWHAGMMQAAAEAREGRPAPAGGDRVDLDGWKRPETAGYFR